MEAPPPGFDALDITDPESAVKGREAIFARFRERQREKNAAELAEASVGAGAAYRHHQETLHICRSYMEKIAAVRDTQIRELQRVAAENPAWPGLVARVQAIERSVAGAVPGDMPAPTVAAGYGFAPAQAAVFKQALDARGATVHGADSEQRRRGSKASSAGSKTAPAHFPPAGAAPAEAKPEKLVGIERAAQVAVGALGAAAGAIPERPAPVFAVGPLPASADPLALAQGTLADGAEVAKQVHRLGFEEFQSLSATGKALAGQVHEALANSEWAAFTAAHGIAYPRFDDAANVKAKRSEAAARVVLDLPLVEMAKSAPLFLSEDRYSEVNRPSALV